MKIFTIIIFIFCGLYSYGQEFLTIGEVYDFEIGDEFHYTDVVRPPNADRITIIGKEYSSAMDTVFYTVAVNNYSSYIDWDSDPDPEVIYTFSTDTTYPSFTNLDSSIFTFHTYNEEYEYDTIIETSGYYCGRIVNGIDFNSGNFEPFRYVYSYGKGIGRIREYFFCGDCGSGGPEWDKKLFYYKKSGIICGTPDNYTGLTDRQINDLVKVYPIPANQFLNIEIPVQNISSVEIRLFNTYGALIMTEKGSNIFKINVSDLSKGIYLLNLNIDNRILNKKILIQ